MTTAIIEDSELTTLAIEDENGNSSEAEVLVSFKHNETDRTFVIFSIVDETIAEDADIEVFASIYDEENKSFIEIKEDDDWKLVEEVLASLSEDEDTL